MSALSILINSINRGVISPVYLFYGAETFLINQALESFYRSLVPEGIGDFNYEKLDGAAASPAQAADSASILPVFAEKRLVVVHRCPWFGAAKGEGEEAADKGTDPLLRYLKNPSPTTCLVFVAGEKIDSRKKLVKEAQKAGQLMEFAPLKGMELSRWIEDRFAALGKKAERQAVEYLVLAVGSSLTLLDAEIEKIVVYTGTEVKVSFQDVKKLVSQNSLFSVFDLIDTVGKRDASSAVSLLREIVKNGEAEIKILAMLSRQVRMMLRMKSLSNKGCRENEMAQLLGVHPFVAKKGLMQSRNFSPDELVRGLEIFLETDVGMKTGKGEPLGLLEMAILKMCSRENAGA